MTKPDATAVADCWCDVTGNMDRKEETAARELAERLHERCRAHGVTLEALLRFWRRHR